MTDTKDTAAYAAPDETPVLSDALLQMVTPKGQPAHRSVGGSDGQVANAAARLTYELDDRRVSPPIPNGWYSIISSDQLAPRQVECVIAVARELVVYRDESGAAHVIAAHCPHLGAHLGGGEVKGDTIQCPYHGWRFGPDGECVEIPYSDARIPSKACVPTYPVCEQDGFVFFWYHASGKAPAYDIPRLSEFEDPEWSDPYPWRFELSAALQEMAENNVDYAHLKYVHRRKDVPNDTSRFATDGPFSTVIEALPDGTDFYRYTWGPGVAVLRVPNMMTVFTTTTPIDRRHCRLNWHFHIAKHAESMAELMIEGVTGGYGLLADVPIWRDKVFLEHPLLVKADGNIAEFRRWYSQFYSGLRVTVAEPTWKAQPEGPDYDAVRQRLVDAAEHLIRDGGVGALRQDAVAARAGLARSSVYRYFDSKADLVTAAVVQSTLRIGSKIQADIGADADPEAFLVRGIIDALEAMADDPLLHALTVPTSSRAMTKLANNALREGVRPLLEPVFEAAAARGVLRAGVSVDDALRWLQVVSLGLMQAPSVVADRRGLEDLLRLMLVPALIEFRSDLTPRQI